MPCPESLFSVSVIQEDDSLVVFLQGELDIATGPILRRAVGKLLSSHMKVVTLDLAALTFVDICGLRAILDVTRLVAGLDADFRLQSPSDSTLRIIRLARFDELRRLS